MNKPNFYKTVQYGLLFTAGAFIYGIGTHVFVSPANIAPGGASGTALLIHHLSGLPVGMLTLAINAPLLILAWFGLSRKFAVSTAIATAFCSIILDFIIAPRFPIYEGDRLLGSLYGGILVGIGMAFIFLTGATTGGTDIIGYMLQKKFPRFSIGKALLAVDGIVLILSIFVFGNLDAALFGLVSLFAQTKVIDAILYGREAGTIAMAITNQPKAISLRIIGELDRSATILSATGAYSGLSKDILLCTVPKSQYAQLKRLVYETDSSAFIISMETSEVMGLGFKQFHSK